MNPSLLKDDHTKLGYHPIQSTENYGYYIDKAPQNVLKELKIQIDQLKNNFNEGEKLNDKLAGEIEHEYLISIQPQTKQYIKILTQQFENESQYITSNYNPKIILGIDNLWVNFQKKHEYNPLHNHIGVYSFVIWYQIPYLLSEERELGYKSNPKNICHGEFNFVIPEPCSLNPPLTSYPLGIDKTKEGYIAIFPSNIYHIVYPFYSSNEYRITLSGNINERGI